MLRITDFVCLEKTIKNKFKKNIFIWNKPKKVNFHFIIRLTFESKFRREPKFKILPDPEPNFGRSLSKIVELCFHIGFLWSFWQQHAVLRETSTHTHTPFPPTPKKRQQTFVLHTQNSESIVLCAKKQSQKSLQKGGKKAAKNAARKVGKKFIPEPVLLLSWNRSCFYLVKG